MNSLLKIGLIAGAGYFLFRDQLAVMFPQFFGAAAASTIPPTQTPAPASTAAPASSSTTTAAAPLPAGTTPASVQTTKDALLKWAKANAFYTQQGNMLNAYQWDYGYQAIRGTAAPGPDVMFPGQDPSRLMTLDEYWTGATAVGLSGVPNRRPVVRLPKPSAAARAWRYPTY